MEKKYLTLLPLAAVPLFFAGKAAVTAIKKKKSHGHNGDGFHEAAPGNIMSAQHSSEHDVLETGTSDMAGTETYSEIAEEQGINPENTPNMNTVNADAELPDEPEGSTTLNENLEERTIFTGPKGGKYFYNKDGKKIYLK